MIEASTAVEKTCAAIERKHEAIIKMIDTHIKTAIEAGQFSIKLTIHDFMEEIGVYLGTTETNSILRLFNEHGYITCKQASGDIYISW